MFKTKRGPDDLVRCSISFTVNHQEFGINNVDPNKSLNTWLRENCLTATKVMCNEGGCGACVVSVYRPAEDSPICVNSCLMPLYTADGCNIITADGIGTLKKGFNQIQERLSQFGGTQCGYCTPGIVMSIYSKVVSSKPFTEQDMENHLDGHICRCTGYRSILDAARSLADGNEIDIEDLCIDHCKKRQGNSCGDHKVKRSVLKMPPSTTKWLRPETFEELKEIMSDQVKFSTSCVFVCANTSKGIYKTTGQPAPRLIIDISRVEEFLVKQVKTCDEKRCIVVGASVSINHLCEVLLSQQTMKMKGNIFERAVKHLKKVAGNPVRNVASWAGNVMIKYRHREFPSDVVVVLEALKARINVYDSVTGEMQQFGVLGNCGLMDTDMDKKVIVSMDIPIPSKKDDDATVFRTYKIMPRTQNAHAYVNAAFRAVIHNGRFDQDVSIIFGNIRFDFEHATRTEMCLSSKEVTEDTFKTALEALTGELQPETTNDVDVSVKFKQNTALSLFYKFYLNCVPSSHLDVRVFSATLDLERDLSSGTQAYLTNAATSPVSDPIPKLSSYIQSSGQAYFLTDLPPSVNEVHCAFVLSDRGNVDIEQINDSFAAAQPGFITLITGANFPKDLKNARYGHLDPIQPLLPAIHIDYAGQPIGLVIAESESQARSIAAQVTVSYKNQGKVLIKTRDSIQAEAFYDLNLPDIVTGHPEEAMEQAPYSVCGEIDLGSQYHFYMESQIARAETTDEGGFIIESATQAQKWLQTAVQYVFDGLPANLIEVKTKRIGGAYGGKATNSLPIALAAALGAYVTERPCRFHADLKTCMASLGTRLPYSLNYTVGFDEDGTLLALDWSVYANTGVSKIDSEIDDDTELRFFADSAYYCPNRRIRRFACGSNLASGTWCRAPGSMQLSAFADTMMEHIADYLNKDPTVVKLTNLYQTGQIALDGQMLTDCRIQEMFECLLKKANVAKRQTAIKTYNQNNKYKKRGLAVTPMKYPVTWQSIKFTVLISIYTDGSVVVSHGGIESGQGINTKIVQVVAYGLQIDVELIAVQRTCTITSANSECTGSSTTSEIVCRSAQRCCEILVERMRVVKMKQTRNLTWEELVTACYDADVDLTASCQRAPPEHNMGARTYNIWGVTATEVEVDILTGEHIVRQVDLVEDAGISLNPVIDIGQIQGAFVMALGFWLNEEMVFNSDSGKLLTDGTWEYKPPTTKDIPVKWNIELAKSKNNVGVYNSKATGEPPLCMAVSAFHAIRHCIDDSLQERHRKDGFTKLQQPLTPVNVKEAINLDPIQDFSVFSCSIM